VHQRLASLRRVAPLCVVCLAACAAEQPSDGARIGETLQPIEGGYVDDFDTQVVGLIHLSNQNFGACSGTLISPNVVLTAHHCVAGSSGGGGVLCGQTVWYAPYPAGEFYVTTRTSFSQNPGDYHAVLEVVLPTDDPNFCGNDQALLILQSPIDGSEASPAVPRVDVSLNPQEEYYAVGYGQTFDSDQAPSGTRYRRDQLHVQCVGAACNDFGINEKEFLGETAVCSGDSGGPAMDMVGRVSGVASRGAPGCEFPIYSHVFGWGQWIKDTTVYAANLGGLEPPPWATGWPTDPAYSQPVGAACGLPTDCPSNACLDGYCTRVCNAQAPCPEQYECQADGYCHQIPQPPATKKKKGTDDEEVGGCAVRDVSSDPTKPIPWRYAPLAALAAAFLARRRHGRRR
jgi:trypsin